MTAGGATAVATLGTFVVIAASAVAALLQLRHLRSGNAISLLTAYNAEFDTIEFQTAFAYVRNDLPAMLGDDALIEELMNVPPFLGEYAKIRTIGNFFEDMGAFVMARLLSADIVCTLYAENVTSAWRTIGPIAILVRESRNLPQLWENFEYLARLSTSFIENHPDGLFPKHVERMPVDDSLLKRWRQRSPAPLETHVR
jgi:hypothetical protein